MPSPLLLLALLMPGAAADPARPVSALRRRMPTQPPPPLAWAGFDLAGRAWHPLVARLPLSTRGERSRYACSCPACRPLPPELQAMP